MGQPSPSPGAAPAGALDLGPVAERIAASAIQLVGGRGARLYSRLDPATAILTRVGAAGEDHPSPAADAAELALCGRVLGEARVVCSPDACGVALAVVPIRTRGEVTGALVLADQPGRDFTDQQISLLSACADQMTLAIEHARLQPSWRDGGDQAQFGAEQVAIAQEVATQLAIAITQARLHEQVKRQAAELEQRVEERTRALEGANRELEAFTHTVSHDLKAPLRGMEGFAQALEEDYADRLDDTGRDLLARIRASAGRMSRLIDELLQYSRIEKRPGARGAVALPPLLDEPLDELAGEIQARGITISVNLAVGEVTGEREGLREALANLLSNAVKFSPVQGGTIEVRSTREGDRIVLAVADRGVGFDMQYHDRIFGIFERLHRQEDYPGTGVGLAIVRKVAERHGGRAWAESAVGQGSTFFLAIPDSGPAD